MKFVLVHGFNVKDGGKHTVDRLAPYIITAGHEVDLDEGDYGFFNIWMVRLFKTWKKNRVLFRLADAFKSADVIITHSNGANFTTQALDLLPAKYNNKIRVIHISPALDKKTEIPQAVKHQLVLYTPNDFWVKLSSYLLFHPWGRMGAVGYQGHDNRNYNVEVPAVKAHSDWFKVEHVARTWKRCTTFLEEFK